MHFATLRLLTSSRKPEEKPRSSCLDLAAKIRARSDGELRRTRAFSTFSFFFVSYYPSPPFFSLRIAPEFFAGCSSGPPRLTEGAVEEFKVGDTCNASATQKRLQQVILYFVYLR